METLQLKWSSSLETGCRRCDEINMGFPGLNKIRRNTQYSFVYPGYSGNMTATPNLLLMLFLHLQSWLITDQQKTLHDVNSFRWYLIKWFPNVPFPLSSPTPPLLCRRKWCKRQEVELWKVKKLQTHSGLMKRRPAGSVRCYMELRVSVYFSSQK